MLNASCQSSWFGAVRLFPKVDEILFAGLESLTRVGYGRTAGDPTWGAANGSNIAWRIVGPDPRSSRNTAERVT